MKKAIELAIKGGWKMPLGFQGWASEAAIPIATNDPSFWQCLGKELGWEKEVTYYNSFTDGKENNDPWRLHWHQFLEALMDGKTPDQFFNSLLE
jgi:hypothetical protein